VSLRLDKQTYRGGIGVRSDPTIKKGEQNVSELFEFAKKLTLDYAKLLQNEKNYFDSELWIGNLKNEKDILKTEKTDEEDK